MAVEKWEFGTSSFRWAAEANVPLLGAAELPPELEKRVLAMFL